MATHRHIAVAAIDVTAAPLGTGFRPNGTDTDAWREHARCATIEPTEVDLFFSEEIMEIAAAKRICAECPVLAPCLEGAIERAEPCGVWGGQLFNEGRVILQKRRRGRPPRVPRPEEQLPVIDVPAHLVDRLPLAG